MKRTTVLWITALVLGWLFDFLFWKQAPGVNYAIYVVLCLAGGFLVLELNGNKPSWRSLLLLVPILFFAATIFVRAEPMSMFLGGAFSLGLMGVLAAGYLGGRWLWYSLADYVVNLVRLAGSMLARPLSFLAETRKQAQAEGSPTGSRSGWKRFWAILRGVLIALPILAIFAALLSSADLIFAQRLSDFTKLFRLEKLPEYIFRCFYILVGAYLLAGVILHAAQKSQDEKLIGVEKPLVPPFLGFTEAAVVLGAVVALFGIFVVIQFQYFFGGSTNISVQGFSYSEFARRGFGELVTVAFFSLLLFLGLSGVVKRQGSAQRWGFSGLGLAMVALVGVILLSAFQRLVLYEAAYGFSRLRAYTHVFMVWLGLLLAVVVVLDILRRERLFALAALLASIGFGVTLTCLNVDAFIVRQNVQRAAAGEELDVAYLASLSTDSVPALVNALQDQALPAGTREAVGAALVCRTKTNTGPQNAGWRSFTLTRWLAGKALAGVESTLDNYSIHEDNRSLLQVESPGGVFYDCWSSGMD